MAQVIERTGGAAEAGIAAGIQQALLGELTREQQKELIDYRAKLDIETYKQRLALREQLDLDAEMRAHKWEIDKLELASRFDFEQNEKERLRKKAMLNSGMETIDDSDAPPEEKAKARFNLKLKFMDIEGHEDALGFISEERGLFDLGRREARPSPTGTPPPTPENPLGINVETTPVGQLPQTILNLEAQNKFEVISPDGETETIDADQWPDYKARGYVLAQIQRLRTEGATPFPLRKVGSIEDLVRRLKRPVGSISDLIE